MISLNIQGIHRDPIPDQAMLLPPPDTRPVILFISQHYRGTSLISNRLPLGPYSRPCLGPYGVSRGVGVSYERDTPVMPPPPPSVDGAFSAQELVSHYVLIKWF